MNEKVSKAIAENHGKAPSAGAVANYGHGKIERPVATVKTIYVQDVDLWRAMKDSAAEQGISASEFIARAIHAALNPTECAKCKRVSEILSAGSQKVVAKGKK